MFYLTDHWAVSMQMTTSSPKNKGDIKIYITQRILLVCKVNTYKIVLQLYIEILYAKMQLSEY